MREVTTTRSTTITDTVTIKIPRAFYDDHIDRDCGQTGRIIHRTKALYTVELDAEAFADLYSDAVYYSDQSQFEREMFGLCRSAAATLKRLDGETHPFYKRGGTVGITYNGEECRVARIIKSTPTTVTVTIDGETLVLDADVLDENFL